MSKFQADERVILKRSCKEYDLLLTQVTNQVMFHIYRQSARGLEWVHSYGLERDAREHFAREFKKCYASEVPHV